MATNTNGRAFYTTPAEKATGNAAKLEAVKLAAAQGVTLTADFPAHTHHEIRATAGDGKRFGSDLHERVYSNAGPTTDGLWQSVLADLREPQIQPEPCTDPDCEWCNQ